MIHSFANTKQQSYRFQDKKTCSLVILWEIIVELLAIILEQIFNEALDIPSDLVGNFLFRFVKSLLVCREVIKLRP